MSLDQFYTKDDIAKKYYLILNTFINIQNFDYIFEPSAGKGSFFKLFPENKRIGIDIDPKYNNVQKCNFFDYNPPKGKIITVGNPPFGKNSSIAVKFFNKCAKWSEVIAFVIPRTFKRISIQNQLDLNFNLIYSEDLPLKPCCFEPNMNAKCCFQIWKKGEKRKKVILPKIHKDFDFLLLGPKDKNNQPTPPENAEFVIKAYGSNSGEIRENNLEKLRPKSWHWIKSNIEVELLKERFRQLDYSISKDTVRQDSIGQGEIIKLYQELFN